MARKNAPPAPPPTSRERVALALRSGDLFGALDQAQEIHRLAPSIENRSFLKRTLVEVASHFADRNKVIEFNRAMDAADRLDPEDANWVAERACLLAKGGRLSDALMRVDEAVRPRVLGHAADRALRIQSKEFLPDDLHAGFDAIRAAFRHYESGRDAAAREALEPIGLRSPFLEWKLLLRGLLAHVENDDARAAENFARLDPQRIPGRLAAPYWSVVDPAWKAKLPIPAANGAHEQYAKLNTSLLADRLREIARLLGRDKPLPPVFRAVESVLPTLKEQQPLLIPRLANCLYHAIILQGQPEDMPRYRKLFGNPPDDPNFYKLQALICEHDNLPEMVHDFWKKFDEWLGTKPPGWPADLLARARSRVWIRLGENAERALKELPDADDDEMFALLRPPKKKKPKPLDPPALACFRKAVEFAPDWSDATKELFKSLEGLKQLAEAEKVAREFLEHQPENLLALTALGSMLHEQGRGREAAELYLRAVALNPLDKSLRTQAVCALQAQARNELAGRNPKGVEAVYERHRQLLDEEMPAAIAVLRAVAFLKLGQIEEADHLRQQALAIPGQRLSAAYRIMVDSQLAKLKPAEKRAADALYAGELAMRLPMPEEVSRLIACYEMYLLENTTYRGQKTHRTKILDQAVRTLTVDAPEQDFEMLANSLFWTKAWKQLKKVADAGMIRFRANPHFLLMRSEAGFATNERHYTIELRLRSAKVLAERSREPRHRALIERIDELLAEVALPFDMFNSFFGRR